MPNRIQVLRSSAPGVLPANGTRLPGELWLNFADWALGFIDTAQTAQKLLAVRWFVPTANYAIGDFVLQGGNLYRALAPSPPGTFVAANWSKVGTAADLTAMQAYVDAADALRLLIAGGTLTGPLILAADPTLALGAATKQYTDTKVPLAGGTMTGPLILSGPPTQNLQAATKAYVDAGAFLPVSGGTLTGPVIAAADPTVPLGLATAQYADRPRWGDNRIINGDMRIDQRNNGASGTATVVYTVDRWLYASNQASKGTWGRVVAGAPLVSLGFGYALNFVSSSAYTSLTADQFTFQQRLEADMISDFAWGTANAQPVTLSFLVNSSLTGTFGGAISNVSRSYPFSYSIPSANTWTKITITIPGDIAGAWTLSGNGVGAYLFFDLGNGANYRGPAGVWASSDYRGVTGSVSVVGTNGAIFNVTGVKLEIGAVATPFNRETPSKTLADCQRYYQITNTFFSGNVTSGGNYYTSTTLRTAMRAAPTVVWQNSGAILFPATPATQAATYLYIIETRAANGSGAGNFQSGAYLSAEL